MFQSKKFTRTVAFKTTQAPSYTVCESPLAEAQPASSTQPPSRHPRRFRTPQRCTMGSQYYDEPHGSPTAGTSVPKLRLSGRWLEHCGFAVGDELQITVGRGVLLVSRRNAEGSGD